MNEALDILFQDAVSTGYKGTKDEFSNLLKTNPEARKIVFDDAVSTGYSGTFDDFNSLIGLTAQPAPTQSDKKKVATALPSAASSSESVSTRPTEPTIATRKPQTTSFGTYGVSKPQPSTTAFTKPVAPEPESISGPVEKDMSVSREVSVRPAEPAMPKPTAPEPTSEANDYFTKSLDIIKSDFVGLAEGEVVPKLKYTFGQYGFQFNEAGNFGLDQVEVVSPDGKTKETFSLDGFVFTDSDSNEAARLRKFISDNRPKSELLTAKEGQYTKPILEDKQIQETIMSLNADTDKLNKDFQEFKRLSNELEAKVGLVESMTPQQKEQFIQASNILEAKRLDIIRREQQIKSRDKSLEAEVGKYASMKGESGNAFTATRDALYGIIDDFYYGAMRGIGGLQTAVGLDNPATRVQSKALEVIPDYKDIVRKKFASESYKEYRESLPWLANAALGVVESVPAMIPAVGLPMSIMQYTGQNYEDLDKADLTEGEKGVYATALAVPSAILAKMGFENAVSEKLLGELLLKRALPRIGINFTLPQITNIIENDVKNLMAKGLLRIAVGGAAEFESGAIEEVIDIGGKKLINALEEKKVFKTPENFLEGLKQVAEAGAAEAVGGAIIGTVSAVNKGYQENKFENLLDEQVELLHQISSDPTLVDAYKVKIKQNVAEGKMTIEEGLKQEASFDKMIGQLNSIPNDISPAGQKEALRLLKERDALQAKIDISDPDLVTKEKARVAEIKEKLQKISTDYAIQKPSTEESVLRDEESQVGLQEMGEGNAKGQAAPQEDKAYVTAQEVNDNVAKANPDASVLLTPSGEDLSLTAVYVGKENRGKGIGTNVLNTVKSEADRVGKKIVLDATNELDSETDLERLGNFYERNGFKRVGENKFEYTPQETVAQEEVTAEPLQQKSSRLLDAIGKARELGADGVDALNSALANLRGIAAERINQIGNRIDDLQQKMRNITKASTIPSATMADLNGKQVNYNGEQATVRISEGGAVSLETPTQIVDLENVTPTTLAADAKVEVIAPAIEFNPDTDRYVDNDNVVINNVEYGINTNAEGNVVGLALKDGSNQVITNEELMKKAEVIRNTEGNVAPKTQTMVSPAVQSDIDALSQEIAALEAERSTIEQETAEPAPAEAPVETDAERRFRGAVLSQTGISPEDLGKLIAVLTKANKNVKVIADKAKMVALLVEKGLSPEQANQVKGVRIGDTVYINPELATVDTPIHEFAHIWGELCKKQRPELWKRGLTLIKMSKYYKELVQRIKDNPELSNLYKTDAQIREEALIQAIGERGATIFDDNKLQLMWNNWLASFDNFIKKVLGLPMNTDITKIKLSEFLDMAATEVLTGKGTGVGGEMTIEKTKAAKDFEFQVEAWHGSPYKFDKFSLSKMGTGEGAQAFGWGLYFTDLKGIAEGYANTLGALKSKVYANGKEVTYGHPLYDYENFIIDANGDIDSVLKELKDIKKEEDDLNIKKNSRYKLRERAIAFLEKSPKIKYEIPRSLYKVSLHEGKTPDQYAFLEWDKPMSDRALGLFQKFNKEQGIKLSEPTEAVAKEDRMTVGQMYKFISDKIGQKEASLFLLENGIDGIKYPAESISRGATSDTARGFNYVVFDENAVKIQEAIQFQAQQSANQLTKIINDGIKAKLTKAQIINILVKSGGMTVEDATNAYNDVKAGNDINVAPEPAPAPEPAAEPAPAPTPTGPKFATQIADAIESMSNGVFDDSVKQALIDNIKAARTQIRQTLTTEKAMRKELIDMLKQMRTSGNLSQSQALSLLRAFATTDIYSDVAVDKFVNYSMNMMQKSQSRFEASNRKSIISKIADLVNKSKRKMVTSSGKPRARALDAVGNSFFVHVNRIVRAAINDDINEMANISAELGSKQTEIYEALVKEANGEPLTAQEADLLDLQYAFDAFGDMMNLSNEELANLYEDLKSARGLSIENMKAFRHARAAEQKLVSERVDQEVKTLNKALYNPDGSLKSQNQRMRDRKAIRAELEKGNVFKAIKLYVTSLNNKSLTNLSRWLRDSISNLETITTFLGKGTSDFFTKQIYDKLFVAEEVQRRGYQSQMEKMNELATKNGFKDFKDLASALSSGKTYTIDTGTESYILDKDEMLRIYALSLNEIQRNKLMNMGIAAAQINEIKNILGDDLVNFANDVVDYLSNEYYNDTNAAYVDEYNTRLPRIENYFPTRTVRSNTTANLIQGNFSQVFRADNASALSNRVDKTGEIILDEGFINTLEGHFQQIERFKTFAPVVRELNYVFSSPAFDAYIEETGTKKLMNLLIRNTVIPDGGNPFPTTKSSIFDKYAGFALAFKAMQIPKQAVAAVSAYEDYRLLKNRSTPILDAVGFAYDLGVAFMTLPKQIKKAREISASFNERYEEGLKGNIASTTSGRGGLRSIKQRSGILGKLYRGTKSAASLPTFLGDTLSVMGYMAVYNRNIANGMSPEKAAMEFNKYNKTLQSRNASDRNALQNEQNSLIKTFTMFGSSAFLQMNKVIQSADKIAAKTFKFAKTGEKSNLPSVSEFRAFMLNLGVANALFAWASYAFKITLGDEEDEDEAFSEMMMALFGLNLLTQLPILGDALELIWTSIKGEGISPKGASLNPYTTVAIKAIKGIKDEDVFEATKPVIELAIGSSIDPAIGLYGLATSTSQKEADESFYKVIGLSKSYQPTIDYGETADQYKARVKKQRAKLKEEDPDLYLKIYGEDPVEEETEKEPKEKEKDRKANLD